MTFATRSLVTKAYTVKALRASTNRTAASGVLSALSSIAFQSPFSSASIDRTISSFVLSGRKTLFIAARNSATAVSCCAFASFASVPFVSSPCVGAFAASFAALTAAFRGRGRLRGFLELRRPWGFSPEARRGSQGASRAAPGKPGLHARGEGECIIAL